MYFYLLVLHQPFVSYVHLYDSNGLTVAIGSLSTPLMKNVTKEGVIKKEMLGVGIARMGSDNFMVFQMGVR